MVLFWQIWAFAALKRKEKFLLGEETQETFESNSSDEF